MLKSAHLRSLLCCVVYLGIVVLIAAFASSKDMCGDGNHQPSCVMFTFGVTLYGGLLIGAVFMLVVLIRLALRRHVPTLLKTSARLYAAALLSFVLPVWGVGNKLAGAIVVMVVLPVSLALLAAGLMCIVVWAGRSWARCPEQMYLKRASS